MAEKKKLDDLDDELARLEAELAALERGEAPPPPPAKKKVSLAERLKKKEEPKPVEAPEAPAEPAPEGEKKFKMPGFLKRGKTEEKPAEAEASSEKPAFLSRLKRKGEAPVVATPEESAPIQVPDVAPAASTRVALAPDNAVWTREGRAWRRVDPARTRPVFRRRMNDAGEVVYEAPASTSELAEATGAEEGEKAVTRGIFGRFLKRKDAEE